MTIDPETLRKIAHLARLQLDPNDQDQMLTDLNGILTFVEKLNEVPTEGIEPLTTMSHEINALREDIVATPLDHEQALKNAPEKEQDYFRVPKVLE
jgi:aspartyl-tRNA(Asn)/glutamyl-tRNA(Gln) amidotransferase subunit C